MTKKLDNAHSKIKKQLSKTYKKETNDEDNYVPFELKIGMSVYIPSLDQEASILSLPDNDGNLFVQAGIIKSKINMKKFNKPRQNFCKFKIKSSRSSN